MNETNTPPNQYYRTAHLYDYDNKELLEDDLPFYLSYAQKAGGPILEMACGTGRLTIPMAEKGFQIDGLDLSQPMLDVFRKKLQDKSDSIGERIRLIHADMANFQTDTRYNLIFIPFRSFQSLTREEDQRNCLACARRHLRPGGTFIIDVFRPYTQLDENWINLNEQIDFKAQIDNTLVQRSHIRKHIEIPEQIIHVEFTYSVQEGQKAPHKITEKLKLKYYYEEQLRTLLIESGFVIREAWGYFDKRDIQMGSELIFVCEST